MSLPHAYVLVCMFVCMEPAIHLALIRLGALTDAEFQPFSIRHHYAASLETRLRQISLFFYFWICLPHSTQSTMTVSHNGSFYLSACHSLRWSGLPPNLAGRQQFVCHAGFSSTKADPTCGIPLDSVMGQILFLLYPADIIT